MSFREFSEEQKEYARQTDMIAFLNQYEGFTFKKTGNSYKCLEHNSLVINNNRNRWYWNSQQCGGNTALDYLQKMKGMSFPEAMANLLKIPIDSLPKRDYIIRKEPVAQKQQALVLPESVSGKYSRLFAYLNQSRKISSNIISELIKNKKIHQDKNNNIVFVGFDKENQAKFACVRGTLTEKQYRGDCSGGDKKYSFSMNGTDKTRLFVFESPIDAMSHATMFNIITKNNDAWKMNCRLSLAGTSDTALEHYLSVNSDAKEIFFCIDNDEAGRSAASEHSQKYSEKGFITKICLPQNKDYNEDLVTYFKNISVQFQQPSAAVNVGRSV